MRALIFSLHDDTKRPPWIVNEKFNTLLNACAHHRQIEVDTALGIGNIL